MSHYRRLPWRGERSRTVKIADMPFKHKYNETDFHACLLVHGWRNNVQNPNAYWYSVDLWFKGAWPERYVDSQEINDHTGQMEFKLQYFTWVRALHQEKSQILDVEHPNTFKRVQHPVDEKFIDAGHQILTQLCNSYKPRKIK